MASLMPASSERQEADAEAVIENNR